MRAVAADALRLSISEQILVVRDGFLCQGRLKWVKSDMKIIYAPAEKFFFFKFVH